MTTLVINDDLNRRIQNVKILIMDCDGTLTNGLITILPDGDETKSFDVRDGHGLSMAIRAGLRTAVITGRKSSSVEHRIEGLGIHHLYQNVKHKIEPFEAILERESLNRTEVAYVGDDVTDIPVMRAVGFAATVPEAGSETKQFAHYVTSARAGHGAIREIIELILKVQGKWDPLMKEYAH
ncbi:MAG TPA: HAD family hydrolase [Blastocatellia bacterium]|nr:HAD family hydrolase [Blastocatellia bacterium]